MAVRKNLSLMGSAHLISFAVNFAGVMFISRLLSPEEIGIYSVAVAVLGFAHIFRDFGVSQFIVQKKELTFHDKRAAFSVNMMISWSLAGIIFLIREPMALFYEEEGIKDILNLLSINFLMLPFAAPILALLKRDLQFNMLAWNTIIAACVQTSVTVGMAYMGYSYLSMAWGALISQLVAMLFLNAVRPGEMFRLPTFKGLGEVLKFGSMASGAALATEAGNSAPDLILGRTLGFAEVAVFSRANAIKKLANRTILQLVQSVYFPTFAKEVREGADPAKLYGTAMTYMVAIFSPIMAVAAVLAEPIILFLFGEQWERAGILASLICFYALVNSPYSLNTLTLVATGHVKKNLNIQLIVQSITIAILFSSLWFELEVVVLLMGVVCILRLIIIHYSLADAIGLTLRGHLSYIVPSLRLIPFAVLGPLGMILLNAHYPVPGGRFVLLACAGVFALSGWMLGIYLIKHPLKNEVTLLLDRIPGFKKAS